MKKKDPPRALGGEDRRDVAGEMEQPDRDSESYRGSIDMPAPKFGEEIPHAPACLKRDADDNTAPPTAVSGLNSCA